MMRKKTRSRIYAALCVICLALLLCGCKSEEQRSAEIDPDDLTGVRVGVNLAWESDYVMTERGDSGYKVCFHL